MMHPVTRFSFPTTIIYGPGALGELKTALNELDVKKPLVVTDAGFSQVPAYAHFLQLLEDERISYAEYNQVQPNPHDSDVTAAAKAFRDGSCDGIIGIGGGSGMDAAKAAALIAKGERTLEQYDVQGGTGPQPGDNLPPVIAIPTTAGTGSEVGKCAVITSTTQKRKYMVCHPQMLPKRAVLDPELTVSLPSSITAATGMDALIHSLESLASPEFNPLCDAIAVKGIELASTNLVQAVLEPENLEARGNMMLSAMMGAIAFQKDLGACHSLSHALSAVCGLQHGLANAVCIVPVMRFNLDVAAGVYTRAAAAMGVNIADMSDKEAAEQAIEEVILLNGAIGIPDSLKELGVKEDQLEEIAAVAYKDPCHQTNPKPCSEKDLAAMLREAWEGYEQ